MKTKLISSIIILSILSAVFFAFLKYIENRDSEIRNGAYAECEAELEKIKNNALTESLQIVINEQESQLAAIHKEREKAIQQAKEQRERTNKLSQKIRELNSAKENNCVRINDDSLRMLNESAEAFNKCGSYKCEN